MVRQSLWMLLATFLFAVVALLVKMASDFYSVWEIIFYRSLFGVALCGVILKQKHISLATTHPWRHLVRCAIGTTCITLGVYTLSVLPLGTVLSLSFHLGRLRAAKAREAFAFCGCSGLRRRAAHSETGLSGGGIDRRVRGRTGRPHRGRR